MDDTDSGSGDASRPEVPEATPPVRSRSRVKIVIRAALTAAAVFLIYLVFTRGEALLVGLFLTVGAAWLTGLILERIDPGRQPDRERSPDDYWGFRGRPGS